MKNRPRPVLRLLPLALLLVPVVGCASASTRFRTHEPPADPPIAPTIVPAPEPAAEPDPGEAPTRPTAPDAPPSDEATRSARRAATASTPDPGARLAESMETFRDADAAWQDGRFDDAIAALDRAYVLMSGAEVGADDALVREKDDLRRLISLRVLDVVASQATGAGDVRSSIPLETNPWVEKELERFRGPEREWFLASVERSGLYRPFILERLREEGLPAELSWLPLVESGFQPRALSSARALGLWQFISSTGTRYGLDRTHWIDERMDPRRSTDAAIAYLRDLHAMFGNWLTALAAYNCGETRVRRVLERQEVAHLDRFWDIYEQLPRETRRYVPRFLATVLVLQDPEAHGFPELPAPAAPPAFATIDVERSVRLADLDAELGLAKGTLVRLNPELRRDATPDGSHALRIPEGMEARVAATVARLPEQEIAVTAVHRVRRGETLSTVAARYGTSVSALMQLNGIRNPHRIRPGQRLQVEVGRAGAPPPTAAGGPEVVTVRGGDNLWTIARRAGTTVSDIRRLNALSSDRLQPGQRLRVRDGSRESTRETYRVRRGDTLAAIASRHRVELGRLLAANGLRRSSTIYPGQSLTIPR